MAISEHILGIDIGTTSTKVVLFALDGTIIGQHAIGYPLMSPQADIQEQDPQAIYQATIGSVYAVVESFPEKAKSIIGMAFSTVMHSLIAVDEKGELLTNSITWADRRSEPWVSKIQQQCNAHNLYVRTGTLIHPMSPLVKLMWLRNEKPELFNRAAKFISIKEYVIYRWFGQYVVDYSIANATGLFNMNALDWDPDALELAGITSSQLSQLVPTTHILSPMTAAAANSMGIRADTPVVIGASDGVLANLGVGAIAPDTIAVTVGTSGAVRAVLDHPQPDPNERLFCYALTEKHWVIGGAINNGGIVLRWVRDNLADAEVDTAYLLKKDAYDILTEIAATVPAGSEGLIFHPYLAGERAPIWDANARGSFFGLGLNHTKAHIIRAVLEGIVYNLHSVLTALEDAVGPAKSIRATGGFAHSSLWRQMLADVFNRTMIVPDSHEGSCFGAAVLGLYALGRIPNLEQVTQMISETHAHQPIATNVERYQKILPLYAQLLDSFMPLYSDMAKIRTGY
ncbi:MAG: gluconokinase [Cyanobacteria bacterium P01_E01_bin.6]